MTYNINAGGAIYPNNTVLTTTSNTIYPNPSIGVTSSWIPLTVPNAATPQPVKKTIYTELQNMQKISSILTIARMKINACEEKFKIANNIVNNYNLPNDEAINLTEQNLKELQFAAEEILNMTKAMQSLLNNEIMEEVIK